MREGGVIFVFLLRQRYYTIILCRRLSRRLWSRHTVVPGRQVVLHAVRSLRHTPDAGAVDRSGRPVDDTHHQVPALPQQSPRAPVPTVHHPTVALRHHSRHVNFSLSAAARRHVHVRGARMELHGLAVLLFHITHHHRSRRLHPGRRARPKLPAAVQADDNR